MGGEGWGEALGFPRRGCANFILHPVLEDSLLAKSGGGENPPPLLVLRRVFIS